MSARQIIEIRNLLESEIQSSLRKTGELDTNSVIKIFKSKRKAELAPAIDDLVDIGLKTLFSEIRKRKKHKLWKEEHKLLFADLPGIRQSIPVKGSDGKTVTKLVPEMTVGELENWLHKDNQPKSRVESNPQLVLLLNQALKGAESTETTVAEAYQAFKDHKTISKKANR